MDQTVNQLDEQALLSCEQALQAIENAPRQTVPFTTGRYADIELTGYSEPATGYTLYFSEDGYIQHGLYYYINGTYSQHFRLQVEELYSVMYAYQDSLPDWVHRVVK